MTTIEQHIQLDQLELEEAKATGEEAKARHLNSELRSLQLYKKHHPDETHDPNALELFCDANPDKPECLIYED